MACSVRVLGGRLCSHVRPGGRVPGYVSRALALRSSSVARRMYDIGHRIYLYVPKAYDRRTVDFHWGTVILLSSILVGPLLIHVGTLVDRCRGTCDKISQYTIPRRELFHHMLLRETTTHAGLCAGIG